jgi:hypothetical protein
MALYGTLLGAELGLTWASPSCRWTTTLFSKPHHAGGHLAMQHEPEELTQAIVTV